MGRPQALVNQTRCVQIVPPDADSEDKFKILPCVDHPEVNSLKGRNIMSVPVPIRDKRSQIWELERPMIKRIKLDEDLSESPIDSSTPNEPSCLRLSDPSYLPLPDSTQQRFNKLNPTNQRLVNDRLVVRNGLVVEFNELITALLGCNTNIGILGSDAQAKAALCYLLKYITKNPSELTHVISLISDARDTIEKYPSQADDTGTEKRTAQHFLTRVANQISSAGEVSSMMAAAALLGMPGETASCGFFYVFPNAALKYVDNHHELRDIFPNEEEEFGESELFQENLEDFHSAEENSSEGEDVILDPLQGNCSADIYDDEQELFGGVTDNDIAASSVSSTIYCLNWKNCCTSAYSLCTSRSSSSRLQFIQLFVRYFDRTTKTRKPNFKQRTKWQRSVRKC